MKHILEAGQSSLEKGEKVNTSLDIFYQGRQDRGLGGYSPPPNISDDGTKPPPNISEDGAKNGLEFVRGVEIHPSPFYLTN